MLRWGSWWSWRGQSQTPQYQLLVVAVVPRVVVETVDVVACGQTSTRQSLRYL